MGGFCALEPHDIRRLVSNVNMAIVNERCKQLVDEAKDLNDLMALVAAGGRASDMIALGSQVLKNYTSNGAD